MLVFGFLGAWPGDRGLSPCLSVGTCVLCVLLLTFPIACWRDLRRRRREQELVSLVNDRTSELRDSQERLRDRNKRLIEAQEAAESGNRAKTAFLANMTHELRTPLNSILGYTQLLLRDGNRADRLTAENREETQRKLRTILTSGEHLLDRINGVLDLSKVESGALMLNLRPVQIRQLLLSRVNDFELRAGQKLLQFTYSFDENLPDWVALDPTRLKQLLSNLVNNAIRFTEKGGIALTVHRVDNALRFEVKDSGIGIQGSDLPHIFEPFFQASNKSLHGHGVGLGLYVSQQILNLWGSKLYVNSEEARGTTFRFEIKTEIVDPDPQPPEGGQVLGFHGPPKSILVIDNDPAARSFLRELLENVGFAVREASSPEEGLRLAHEVLPDALISDIRMAGIDSICRQIGRSPRSAKLIFIASSVNVHENDDRALIDTGFHDFLSKPIKQQELFAILAKHLRLNWISQNTINQPTPTPVFSTSRDAFAVPMDEPIPAKEILDELLCCARRGDVMLLRDHLKKIRDADSRYDPFCERLSVVLTEFRMSALEQIIKMAIDRTNLLQESVR
jgi:signal transduction histidine kinase/ActR/RegA family two-component response regulator